MKGRYSMQRGWMEHPIFKDEPFTEREAWVWLIEKASFQPHEMRDRKSSRMIKVNRGQLVTAYRVLARTFGWSVNRVRNYITLLKTEHMIDTHTDTHYTVITICNYNQYQFPLRNTDTQPDTQPDTVPDTQPDTDTDTRINNINNINKGNKEREAHTKNFKDLKLEGEYEIAGNESGLEGEALQKCWQKWKINRDGNPPDDPLANWKIWALNEYKPPEATEKPLSEEELKIQLVGIANWRRNHKKLMSPEQIKLLTEWEKTKGRVTWNHLEDYRKMRLAG